MDRAKTARVTLLYSLIFCILFLGRHAAPVRSGQLVNDGEDLSHRGGLVLALEVLGLPVRLEHVAHVRVLQPLHHPRRCAAGIVLDDDVDVRELRPQVQRLINLHIYIYLYIDQLPPPLHLAHSQDPRSSLFFLKGASPGLIRPGRPNSRLSMIPYKPENLRIPKNLESKASRVSQCCRGPGFTLYWEAGFNKEPGFRDLRHTGSKGHDHDGGGEGEGAAGGGRPGVERGGASRYGCPRRSRSKPGSSASSKG